MVEGVDGRSLNVGDNRHTTMQTKLLIGYFPGWCQCSTGKSSVLICGEDLSAISAIVELQNLFIKLAKGEVQEVQLHTLSFFEPVGGIAVVARLSDEDKGIQKLGDGNVFVWETTPKYWGLFVEEVAVFHNLPPERGSHQYLDTYVNYGVDVEVSVNEYSAEWFKQAYNLGQNMIHSVSTSTQQGVYGVRT